MMACIHKKGNKASLFQKKKKKKKKRQYKYIMNHLWSQSVGVLYTDRIKNGLGSRIPTEKPSSASGIHLSIGSRFPATAFSSSSTHCSLPAQPLMLVGTCRLPMCATKCTISRQFCDD